MDLSTVDLSIDGGARMSFTNPTAPSDRLDWELFTVPFTATGTTRPTSPSSSGVSRITTSAHSTTCRSRPPSPNPPPLFSWESEPPA